MVPLLLNHIKGWALAAYIAMGFFLTLYCFNVFANFSLEEYSLPITDYFSYVILFCVFPMLFFSALRSEEDFDRLANIIIFSGFLLGVVSYFLYAEQITGGVTRISAISRDNDDASYLSPLALSYSGSLTIIVSLMKLMSTTSRTLQKVFYLSAAISGLYCFMLGASRGSVVSLFISFILLLVIYRARFRLSTLIFLISILVCVPTFLSITGSGVFERVLNIRADVESGASSSARVEIWRAAFDSIKENPFFGGRIEVFGNYPHNFLVEAFMVTGLVGGGLFLFSYLYFSAKSFKLAVSEKYILPFLILTHGSVEKFFSGSVKDSILIFIALGMTCSALRLSREREACA
ncbi:O-antigen ligase family protein [Isoalcanivorax beigongshangi]|uniref:O-antigen ligase family protein n=1 Tax=Isoalcanivorax beigongshangi TaxID=3238810 RepID=A0ABV4AHZ2_9GAMM